MDPGRHRQLAVGGIAATALSTPDDDAEMRGLQVRDMGSPLMQAIPDFYLDIQNDVALLQRLELRGVDVGHRWSDVGDLAATRIVNHTHPFTSAHCALALAAAGRFAEAIELVRDMHTFVAQDRGTLGPRYALAAIPAAEAAIAYRKREHQRVLDVLPSSYRRAAISGRWAAATPSATSSSSSSPTPPTTSVAPMSSRCCSGNCGAWDSNTSRNAPATPMPSPRSVSGTL